MNSQNIDKDEPKWGREVTPLPNSGNYKPFAAKCEAKRAIFNTIYTCVRKHFANNEVFDPKVLNFSINPAMILQIDREHERSRKRVKLSED